ncbi:MAG TPA: vWA domain-containing protein [Pengzhenrongella sp.]
MQWLKRSYESVGLTQYPVGRHLAAVQSQFGGAVVLCLDVSGSMSVESRLERAVDGCLRFIDEAVRAGYEVSALLWHHDVAAYTPLSHSADQAKRLFASARAAGGTNVVPALGVCEGLLQGRKGDLVIAIFGDGDLGNPTSAAQEATRLTEKDIRVLTCGLGMASAEQLGAISTEGAAAPRTATADTIADAIADMASGLKRRN